LGACSGSGGSAAPTASLPLPASDPSDPITVSSPDANGFVVVTGTSSAVPEAAKIIVTVSSSSSSLDIDFFLFSTAYAASSCTSELAECPTLTDGQCQYDANDDGSFVLQVPASISDTIGISYLDNTTCEEVSAYSKTVESGITSLQMSAKDIALDDVNDQLLIFGSVEDVTTLDIIDAKNGSEVTSLTPSISGTPEGVQFFKDVVPTATKSFVFLKTSEQSKLGSLTNNALGTDFKKLVNSSGTALENLDYLTAQQFTLPLTLDSECLSDFDQESQHTRIFMTNDEDLYILDSITDLSLNSQSTSGDYIPRKLDITLDFDSTVKAIDVPIMIMEDVMYILVIRYDNNTPGQTVYYVLKDTNFSGLCGNEISIGTDSFRVSLTFSNEDIQVVYFSSFDASGETKNLLGFLDREAQVIKFVDISNMETADTFNISDLVEAYSDLEITSVEEFLGISRSNSTIFELFLVGSDTNGAGFVASDESTTAFGTGNQASVIDPKKVIYYDSLSQIYILDKGLSGSENSNLIIVDVAE